MIQKTQIFPFAIAVLVAGVVALMGVAGVSAQVAVAPWRVVGDAAAFSMDDDSTSEEVPGAMLKTDPDLEGWLEKANRHAKEKSYRVATKLWQAVLERSGDSLSSDDDQMYFSMGDRVEKLLADLPTEALDVYRVTADAAAKELLNQGGDVDVTALTRVTSNYFASSVGDDAALKLGSIYLDRYDFTGALRVLRKIVDHHPDPSVALDEVWARIAVCHAFLGNEEMAAKAIATGRSIAVDSSSIDAVERSLGKLEFKPKQEMALSEWVLPLGSQSRLAAMPSLPESAFSTDQVCVWQYMVAPSENRIVNRPDTIGKILVGDRARGEVAASSRTAIEKRMVTKWREEGWRPSGELLFDSQRVYFKGPGDVVAFDRARIPVSAETPDEKPKKHPQLKEFASWRSLWRNVFDVDAATKSREMFRGATARLRTSRLRTRATRNTVSVVAKSLYFLDRIHQQMAIHDSVLYTVEGTLFDSTSRQPRVSSRHSTYNPAIRRTRSNFLTAYDQETGKMLWRLPRVENKPESPSYELAMYANGTVPKKEVDEESEWLIAGGIMGAPLKFGDILIIPVNQSGAIHLFGVDPSKEGKTVWSCFLCDDPESGSVANSPINMSLDGSDVLVTCGTGVVFLVDPSTGKVRFAKRYSRRGTSGSPVRRHASTVAVYEFDGWSSDSILPNGRELICFCSDTETVTAIDRNTGETVWKQGLSPYGAKLDYIIGAYDRKLFLGGRRTVMAIALDQQGRVAWGGEPHFGEDVSCGRGMVTPQGVFVPVGNSIWRFALDGEKGRGKVLNQVEAFLGTEAPVGNLYSDGERIWVRGATRLYALAPKPFPEKEKQ